MSSTDRLYERRIKRASMVEAALALPQLRPRLQPVATPDGMRDRAAKQSLSDEPSLQTEFPTLNPIAIRPTLNDSSSSGDCTPPSRGPPQRTFTEPHLNSLRMRRKTQPHLPRRETEETGPPTPTTKSRVQECVANMVPETRRPCPPVQKGSVFQVTSQKKNLSPLVPGSFQPLLSFQPARQRNLLVLDIDETLVHASVEQPPACDITIPVVYKNASGNVYVRLRPNVMDFLGFVFELFDVVTFTASLPLYASPLMDQLDPHGRLKGRFYREHCSNFGGVLVKDLVRLGWPLERCVILDNCPQAYALQPRNGIPIPSFMGDRRDRELVNIIPLLRKLSEVEDVYPLLDSFNSDL